MDVVKRFNFNTVFVIICFSYLESSSRNPELIPSSPPILLALLIQFNGRIIQTKRNIPQHTIERKGFGLFPGLQGIVIVYSSRNEAGQQDRCHSYDGLPALTSWRSRSSHQAPPAMVHLFTHDLCNSEDWLK